MDTFVMRYEKKAEEFVNSYQDASGEDISKIIAGMTAIIEGNEKTYESMKNQKWFQRIWYGLTFRNKATVKEMQANRDQLTKYTALILVKMNTIISKHSECIFDLYRAIAVVRKDYDSIVDEVTCLAHRLNEKIICVDNYYFLLHEILNHKFDLSTPLISLIDIMSLIDSKTATDAKKMIQIKETMERNGFDFSKTVSIMDYSIEVMSLPDEKVGRILLFCQNLSSRSQFLAYTCFLIEQYFYSCDSDNIPIKDDWESIRSAAEEVQLASYESCSLAEMFNILKQSIPESFDIEDIYERNDNNSIYTNTDTVLSYGERNDIAPKDNEVKTEKKKADYKKTIKSKRTEASKLLDNKQIVQCNAIIHTASVAAAAGGAIPLPVADAIPISAAQITMVIALGKVFGQEITSSAAKGIITAAASTFVGRNLVKIIPVLGWTISAAVAAGITEAIGWTLVVDMAKASKKAK